MVPARPLLVTFDDPPVLAAITRACTAAARPLPMVVLPQLHLVRDYLRDSARAGRCPSVAVVRVPDASSDEWSLTQWIRGSDGAIGQIRLVLLTDCTVDPPNRSALLVAAAAEGATLESVVAEALTHRQ